MRPACKMQWQGHTDGHDHTCMNDEGHELSAHKCFCGAIAATSNFRSLAEDGPYRSELKAMARARGYDPEEIG